MYASAASRGALGATQVADRWHIVHNLADALERMAVRVLAHSYKHLIPLSYIYPGIHIRNQPDRTALPQLDCVTNAMSPQQIVVPFQFAGSEVLASIEGA